MKKSFIIWMFLIISFISIVVNVALYMEYNGIKSENDQLTLISRNYLEESKIHEAKAVTDKAVTDKAVTDKAVTDKAVTDKAVTDKAIEDKAIEGSPLDEQYDKELDDAHGVTLKLIEISIKYADLWKQEMEQYYCLLMDKLDEDNKTCLINSQKSWETYATENSELIFKSNFQLSGGGGSFLRIVHADLMYQKYRDRAIELKKLYKLFDLTN